MMRIIAGTRRGKKLLSLPGDNTRPTLERVKQAVFSALQFEIADKQVLDLFSGSGQLGLEALSRGAAFCWFNDSSLDACSVIRKNIDACGFAQMCELTCKSHIDCVTMIKRMNKKVSLVFLDPPYGKGLIGEALDLLRGVLSDDAVIVCESGVAEEIDAPWLSVRKEYRYSGIKITMLENRGEIK